MLVHYHRGEERARAARGRARRCARRAGRPHGSRRTSTGSSTKRAWRSARSTSAPPSPVSIRRDDVPRLGAPARALGGDAARRTSRPRSSPRGRSCAKSRATGHGSLVLVGSTAGHLRRGRSRRLRRREVRRSSGGLLLSLKNEVARIAPLARVNAVAPGWTVSPMTRGLVDDAQVRAHHADDGAPQGRAARGRRRAGRRPRIRHALRPRHRPGRDRRRRHGRPRTSTTTEEPP